MWNGIEYNERQATLWHNKLAHIILYGADERGREHLVEARKSLAALLEQRAPGNQRHRTAQWWESKKTSLRRMWNEAEEVAQGRRAPKLGKQRDPSRESKRREHGKRATEYVKRGREAELAGHFASAAVWYKKAGAAYEKAGNRTRARLWKARGKDVNAGQKMGTLYRGRDASKKDYMVVWQGGSSKPFASRASAISEARLISVESGETVAVVEREGYHIREISRVRGGRVIAGVGKGTGRDPSRRLSPQKRAALSRKIRKLRHEGYPQAQAVAIAHRMLEIPKPRARRRARR